MPLAITLSMHTLPLSAVVDFDHHDALHFVTERVFTIRSCRGWEAETGFSRALFFVRDGGMLGHQVLLVAFLSILSELYAVRRRCLLYANRSLTDICILCQTTRCCFSSGGMI